MADPATGPAPDPAPGPFAGPAAGRVTIGWVVLTIGTNLPELHAALESIRTQTVSGPVLVVCNGVTVDLPDWVRVLQLDDNAGIPGGRELGLRALDDVDVVCFLDDDAVLVHDRVAERIATMFADDPAVAAVSLAVVNDRGEHQQRYVPRLLSRGAARSGEVTYFAGCAHALRRDAFLQAGGYDETFFYGHEETDLSWRLVDHGHRLVYDARPAVRHPQVDPRDMATERHAWLARNRVWMARRNLPAPLHWTYSGAWLALTAARYGTGEELSTYWQAWRRAWDDEVDRAPISWRTVWRLGRLGRPPLV